MAASVAGLVSLGVQVYSGISTYLDAFRGRDDDLGSARQVIKTLGDVVYAIEQLIPQLQANSQIHANAVLECVQSCQTELASFQNFLPELGSSSKSSGTFRDSVRDHKKKLTYAFQRSNLDRLESRLGRVNGILPTALQMLTL